MALLLGKTKVKLPIIGADSPLAQADDLDLWSCLLYTSDAADERSSVDLGGRRIIKKKQHDVESGDLCI